MSNQQWAMDLILEERKRQHEQWGEQNHSMSDWMLILHEETGELSEAILHKKFGGPKANQILNESVDVAAVALQIVEFLKRKEHVACAACDRGDFQLGHVDGCK